MHVDLHKWKCALCKSTNTHHTRMRIRTYNTDNTGDNAFTWGHTFANAQPMPVFECIQIKCNPIYLLWMHVNRSTQESLYWFGLNCHMGSLSVTTMPRMQPTKSYSSRWWWWWSWPCWWLYQMAVARMSWMHPKKLYRSQYVSSVAKSIQLSHPDLLMSKRF